MNSELVMHGAGDRGLHQVEHARVQGGQRDDELGEVAQGRVEQPAHGVTGPRRHALRRLAERRRQRHERQHRKHEQCRVAVRSDVFDGE
jgi:hypothetical protein